MSQKNKVNLSCSNCNHQFEATLYRTIWGESQGNRDLVMKDMINVVECPSCHTKTKVEYALFYNDTTVYCGVWWEPNPEPEIDQCTVGWSQMFGENNYMVQAPRMKDWNEFKVTINKFYTGELKGTPPVQLSKKNKNRNRVPKIPKPSKKQSLEILVVFLLLASLSIAGGSLYQISYLKKQISDLKQAVEDSGYDYSSEISNLEERIDDCDSHISDLEGEVSVLQRDSHYRY